MVKISEKIKRVACGVDFTACITVTGKLYTWGFNRWGNLGVESVDNKEHSIVTTPSIIKSLSDKRIIDV